MGDMGAGWGVLVVETIAKIRRAYFAQKKPIKAICREFRLSRKVVRKVIRSQATEFRYERGRQPLPRIDPWRNQLDDLLLANEGNAARERLTLIRIFEELRGLGYEGSYDAVRRYARKWRGGRGGGTAEAYVPLSFAPGEAYQFDWSHEVVLIGGTTVTVKGGARPAVPQPHAVRARLSARDPGDGVRRAHPSFRLLQGSVHPRHLRQHEDGRRRGVRRQRPPVQPALSADVRSLSGRAGRLHTGGGLGEGSGREPSRAGARTVLHAAAAGDELR